MGWTEALEASEHLATGPTSSTSWLLAWLRAAGPTAVLLVGSTADDRTALVAALERRSSGLHPTLGTVGFRQGPQSGVRAAEPIQRLFDERSSRLCADALRSAGRSAAGIVLADVAGAPIPGGGGPLTVLQHNWTAVATIPDLDDDDWERRFFGTKQRKQIRRSLRTVVAEQGTISVRASTSVDDVRATIDAKRQLSVDRAGTSQIFADTLDRWIPLIVAESRARQDLEILHVTLFGDDQVLASTFGLLSGGQVDGLVQVYDPGAARHGPGRLALREFLAVARSRGGRVLDLGRVEGDDLPPFATDRVATCDFYLPLSPVDRLAAPLAPVGLRLRRRLRAASKPSRSGAKFSLLRREHVP